MIFRQLVRFLYKITSPLSKSKDKKRREFILNILLVSSMGLSGLAGISLTIRFFSLGRGYNGNSPLTIFLIFLIFLFLYFLSRKGLFIISSYIFLLIYFVPTILAIYKWSIYLPQAILTLALLIVMANILVSTKFGIFVTFIVSILLIVIGSLESSKLIPYDLSWTVNSAPGIADAVVYMLTFIIITLVSWLFNRESERALLRAQLSEAALQRERNLLEVNVEKRTKELRQAQIEKTLQLYRFAEFGKFASGVFHDFSNSVNLVSLNLNELKKKDVTGLADIKDIISRAQIGLTQMENFLDAAKKQVNNQNIRELFSVHEEVSRVINILAYKAKLDQIYIETSIDKSIKMYGNPIKFHQLVTNLLSNAIDSYYQSTKKNKLISLKIKDKSDMLELTCIDYGVGISSKDMKHVFEPFFTTKSMNRGTGLGLSISQNIAMQDFKGNLSIISKKNKGTTVVAILNKNP